MYYKFPIEENWGKDSKRESRRKLIQQALNNVSALKTILEYVRFWETVYYQDGLKYQ